MTAVGQIAERQERPALVRFQRRTQENKAESVKQGKYVADNVDWALITPPYSKDVHETKVSTWLAQMDTDVRNGRLPDAWRDQYVAAYEKWKKGEEIPLNGTPIKGWGVISPAQQEMLIRINILTVEDLAGVNDEGCRRIGMGSLDLKNKAAAWLAQLQDKGPLTIKVAALEAAVAEKDGQIAALKHKVELLQNDLRVAQMPRPTIDVTGTDSIGLSDITDDRI